MFKLLQTLALTFLLSPTIHASPLFQLTSTSTLPLSPSDPRDNSPTSAVQRVLWRSLSSCPTTHYAVVIEPLTLSYTSSSSHNNNDFLAYNTPTPPNVRSNYTVHSIDGKINIVHVVNTILMDCLHHGILRVEELDTVHMRLPELSPETVRKSIMYIRMPEVDKDMRREEYEVVMRERKEYTEKVVDKYFGNEEYTLIYIREEVVQGVEDAVVGGHQENGGDGMEVPLVEDHGSQRG